MSTHERPLQTCDHGVVAGIVQGFKLVDRCGFCAEERIRESERQRIQSFGVGYIKGLDATGDTESGNAIDLFLSQVRSIPHV